MPTAPVEQHRCALFIFWGHKVILLTNLNFFLLSIDFTLFFGKGDEQMFSSLKTDHKRWDAMGLLFGGFQRSRASERDVVWNRCTIKLVQMKWFCNFINSSLLLASFGRDVLTLCHGSTNCSMKIAWVLLSLSVRQEEGLMEQLEWWSWWSKQIIWHCRWWTGQNNRANHAINYSSFFRFSVHFSLALARPNLPFPSSRLDRHNRLDSLLEISFQKKKRGVKYAMF